MNKDIIEPLYLNKSKRFYQIYAGLVLFALFMSVAVRPSMSGYPALLDALIGLPFLVMFIMAPIGIHYSWKSYKRREGRGSTRFMYFVGHSFFCMLIILFIVTIINDLSQIF